MWYQEKLAVSISNRALCRLSVASLKSIFDDQSIAGFGFKKEANRVPL